MAFSFSVLGVAFADDEESTGELSGSNADITLVMFSAKDCVFCARWKGSLGGRGDLERWPDKDKIKFYIVEKEAIAGAFLPEQFPTELSWLQKRMAQKNAKAGVPSFRIFVGHKRVAQEYGYSSWERTIFPLLKNLVEKKKNNSL